MNDCLASTGLDSAGAIFAAIALLLAGVALVAFARKGRRVRGGIVLLGILAIAVTGIVAPASPASAATCPPTPAASSTPGVPDLTPSFTITPNDVVNNGNVIEARVQVDEINGAPTDGTDVYISIPVSLHFTIQPYDSTATTSAGGAVQNSDWSYLGEFGGRHFFQYIGATVIGANGNSAVGFTMIYDSDNQSGVENVVVTIVDGSGGETNFLNNTADVSITFETVVP